MRRVRKLYVWLICLSAWPSVCGAAVPPPGESPGFSCRRLERIASGLSLSALDTIPPSSQAGGYMFSGRPLSIRTDELGDVTHIGLKLFAGEHRDAYGMLLCDFLERMLLERLLPNLHEELSFRQSFDHVTFVLGRPQSVFALDGSETLKVEQQDLRAYRVTWSKTDVPLLVISFDMDIELLSGANAIERETQFVRRLSAAPSALSVQPAVSPQPDDGEQHPDTFLIGAMRGNLYFETDAQGRHRLCTSSASLTRSLSNMLLCPGFFTQSGQQDEAPSQPMLLLSIDRYGYERDTFRLPYRRLLCLCLQDGCKPYFGFKERRGDGSYTGLVLFVNAHGGYVHSLSVTLPGDILAPGPDEEYISGVAHLYIPLHNVSESYFKSNSNTNPFTLLEDGEE